MANSSHFNRDFPLFRQKALHPGNSLVSGKLRWPLGVMLQNYPPVGNEGGMLLCTLMLLSLLGQPCSARSTCPAPSHHVLVGELGRSNGGA